MIEIAMDWPGIDGQRKNINRQKAKNNYILKRRFENGKD